MGRGTMPGFYQPAHSVRQEGLGRNDCLTIIRPLSINQIPRGSLSILLLTLSIDSPRFLFPHLFTALHLCPCIIQSVTDTPPRHPSAGKSPSSVCQKSSSPNAKRLKRMKDRMKEMKQWCEELIREEDEEDTNNNTTHQFVEELNDPEESKCKPAWAETTGESSIIHFNCLCGKAYQLLLYANSCYYMLMPFEQENCETETQEMISVERNGEWLSIYTQCPCTNGYMILLRGSDCYYKLIDSVSS